METRKRTKIFNVLMAVLIAVIVFCGTMTAGALRGWFSSDSFAYSEDVKGIVNIERSGVGYTLDEKTQLKDGDVIDTGTSSSASVIAGKNTIYISEDTEVELSGLEKERLGISLDDGELFAVLDKGDQFRKVEAGSCEISSDGSVFSVNVQTGSAGINVFDGSITVKAGDEKKTAKKGQTVSIVGDEMTVSDLEAGSLNDFNIENAKTAGEDGHDICFSGSELDKVTADREAEIKKTEKQKKKHEAEVIAAAGSGQSGDYGSGSGSGREAVKLCTVQIECSSVLSNMGQLKSGKESFVPSNGVILASSSVEFREGDTAFDILRRACDTAGIQLEYSYTPAYGSYYIEGINNLYEFDCGSRSGWTYRVNGWMPNYGSSSYKMKEGDVLVWSYTCNGI